MKPTGVLPILLMIASTHADPLHEIGAGAVQHEDSSWIFPQHVAGFARIGSPQTMDGSRDASAYYECVIDGARFVIQVQVHSAESAAAQAPVVSSAGTPTRFPVGRSRPLITIKRVDTQAHDIQYLADTGPWLISIRAPAAKGGAPMPPMDEFVRQLPWDSLALSDATCTGPACR